MSSSLSPSTASSGRVRSNTRSSLLGAWVFAALWNLVSAPILFLVPRELERNAIAAIAFAFPVIGAGLIAWAVMLTLRWRRFGPSWFEMSPMPASPGGVCAGTIRTRLERPPVGEGLLVVTLKLTCLQRVVRGHGKHRSVRENIVWREEQSVGAEAILFTPAGAAIPVHFALPADALETTASGRSAGVFWALTAEASLPGVDLNEDFDVPVSGGPEHRSAQREGGAFVPVSPPALKPVTRHDLAAAGIHVRQTEAGIEYHFAAARNPSFAIGLTVFLLIWSGAIWLQLALEVPWIFTVLTALFELLLLVIVADLWLGSTIVTIGSDTIRRRHSLFGWGTVRAIRSKDVASINLHITMQTSGRFGTPYYEIRATTKGGRRAPLGSGIRNKAHAEWLASEMRSAIGVGS